MRFRRNRQQGPLTSGQRNTFLEVLGRGGTVGTAALAAGRHRRRFYDLRNRDADFANEWLRAENTRPMFVEPFVNNAERREQEGVEDVPAALDNSPYPAYPRLAGETTSDLHMRVTLADDKKWRKSLLENGQLWRPFTESDAWLDRDEGPLSRVEPGKPRYYHPSYDD